MDDIGVQRGRLTTWIERYERLWRTAGTSDLGDMFAADVTYSPSPWKEPIQGLDALRVFWEDHRDGSDESFALTGEVVAVDANIGVARIEVAYEQGPTWRDLWIVHFNADGKCAVFEEWPFTAKQ